MFGRRFRMMSAVVLTTIGLSGGPFTSNAHAGFYKVIAPPTGTGGEKEVDPPIPPVDTPPTTHTPEPGTLVLAIMGGGALAAWRRRK